MRCMSLPAGRLAWCSTFVDVPLTVRFTFPVARVAFVTRSKYVSAADRRLDGLADRALDAEDGFEPQRLRTHDSRAVTMAER